MQHAGQALWLIFAVRMRFVKQDGSIVFKALSVKEKKFRRFDVKIFCHKLDTCYYILICKGYLVI